jgi:hypothetical protein
MGGLEKAMVLQIVLLLVLICELQNGVQASCCFYPVFVGLNKSGMMTAKSVD